MPPVTQKLVGAAAVLVLILGGIGYQIYKKTAENGEIETKIQALQTEISGLDAIIRTRKDRETQREQQKRSFDELVQILPLASERNEEDMITALNLFALQARINITNENPHVETAKLSAGSAPGSSAATTPSGPAPPRPAPGPAADQFNRTEHRLNLEGTYSNFVKFLSLIEDSEQFLRVDSFSITPQVVQQAPQPEQRLCNLSITVSTYSYAPK